MGSAVIGWFFGSNVGSTQLENQVHLAAVLCFVMQPVDDAVGDSRRAAVGFSQLHKLFVRPAIQQFDYATQLPSKQLS